MSEKSAGTESCLVSTQAVASAEDNMDTENRTVGTAKKIGQRSCVGCRKVQDKREMLRIVRTPEGAIELDMTGKAPGRGAYLCKSATCLQTALKKRQLNRVFKSQVPSELYDRLAEVVKSYENIPL